MTKAKNVHEYIARQRASLAGNPECGTSRYNLAVALLGLKQYEEAEKELKEAIYCSPSLAEAYVQLGGLRLQQGDLDGCMEYNQQAIKALERAAALEPTFSEIRDHLGDAHWRTGRQDEARKCWGQALSLKPDPADAQKIKGKIARGLEK